MESDKEIIESLGGPAKVAELLKYDKTKGGVQRVNNWVSRGIPPRVKLDNPDIFLKELIGTTAKNGCRESGGANTDHPAPEMKAA